MSRPRSPLLILFVIGLAAAGSTMIPRPTGADTANFTDRTLPRTVPFEKNRRAQSPTAIGSDPDVSAAGFIHETKHAEIVRADFTETRNEHRAVSASANAIHVDSAVNRTIVPRSPIHEDTAPAAPSSAPSPPAIQLADNVRLPAALMPQTNAANLKPAVAKATEEIANTYYRDLQAEVAVPHGTQDSPDNIGDTVTIRQIPETEGIRLRSDEQFRALYGDEKYNQQAISSAIEVMLPSETAVP